MLQMAGTCIEMWPFVYKWAALYPCLHSNTGLVTVRRGCYFEPMSRKERTGVNSMIRTDRISMPYVSARMLQAVVRALAKPSWRISS